MSSATFRASVEAADLDAIVATLSDDVVLHSPVTFKPFVGRDAVALLFSILLRTFEDFRYVAEFISPDGSTVLRFETRIGDREVEGIDIIHVGDVGLIDDITVMVRPLSAMLALRDKVGAALAG